MTFCFRIRCTLPAKVTVASDDPQWVLATRDSHGEHVVLAPAEGGTVGGSRHLVVRGSSFHSADAALAAGQRWMPKIQTAFARMRIGADFGTQGTPGGMFFEGGLRMLEEKYGGRMLNDVLGLSVFECEPVPRFVTLGGASVSVGRAGAGVLRLLSVQRLSHNPIRAAEAFTALHDPITTHDGHRIAGLRLGDRRAQALL